MNGLCGNEDVGQMSAWYILAAIGIHPICPGDNVYELTSPMVNKVTIPLDNQYYKGKKFTVLARNNSEENIYIVCFFEWKEIKPLVDYASGNSARGSIGVCDGEISE